MLQDHIPDSQVSQYATGSDIPDVFAIRVSDDTADRAAENVLLDFIKYRRAGSCCKSGDHG